MSPRFVLSLSLPCLALGCLLLGGCTEAQLAGEKRTAIYAAKPLSVEEGVASWYRDRRTASGERFDSRALTAAHRKLPFNSKVRVIDLSTKKSVIVRINDRGPYAKGRIIDLTSAAAQEIGIFHRGVAQVRLEVLREIPIMTKPNLRLKPGAEAAMVASPQFAQADSPVARREVH